MTLGNLEFKAEDFERLGGHETPNGHDDDVVKDVVRRKELAAEIANRLLAERLEKALKVYSTGESYDFGNTLWSDDPEQMSDEPTHTARLVCVEEVK